MWLGRDLRGTMAGLPLDPRQGRHLIVLGETGMGKSSLVVRLGWQALHWGSVLFFDPIGDTAREFLSGVPEARASQVSWVSPAVRGLTLSLLGEIETSSGRDPARRERMVGDVVAALRRVRAGRYVESTYWGPRIEEMLSQAIRAASLWPGASLALAERLLTPGAFPSRPIPPVARAAVADVRRRIDISPQDGDGARRLLSEITRSDVLRGILDAEAPTWAIGASVLPGRITVVSGDAPQVGESVARYLLAVVLALAWNAALAREQPTKTFLILDEAQWYAHDSVAEMLRLGRRFNLHVWAATQSLRSLPESIREAFTTNSADVVLFRGAPEEVRDFARWVPELGPERIMRMPRAEAAVLIGKGSRVHWIRLSPPKLGGSDPIHFAPRFPNAEAARDPERPIRSPAGECEPASARADPSTPPNEDPLARALRDLEAQAGSQAELTVRLSEVRSRWAGDPAIAESSVRTGGRTLASAGVLLRTGRDSSGSFWVLSRERLREMLGAQPIGTRSGTTADSNPLAPSEVPIPP